MAIEVLDAEDFLPHVGTAFPVAGSEGAVSLELLSVTPARHVVAGQRAGFSLLFRSTFPAPAEQTVLGLLHPTRGELGVFVVPVGQDADGVHFEAVFN